MIIWIGNILCQCKRITVWSSLLWTGSILDESHIHIYSYVARIEEPSIFITIIGVWCSLCQSLLSVGMNTDEVHSRCSWEEYDGQTVWCHMTCTWRHSWSSGFSSSTSHSIAVEVSGLKDSILTLLLLLLFCSSPLQFPFGWIVLDNTEYGTGLAYSARRGTFIHCYIPNTMECLMGNIKHQVMVIVVTMRVATFLDVRIFPTD